MTSEEGLDASHKSFMYLLLGYFIIAPTSVYGVAAELGSFATGETLSAAAYSVLDFSNIIGFVVVVYSHILYLSETETPSYESDRPSLFEKEVAGNSLKFILGLASVSVLTLVYINAVLMNYEFYQVTDSELGYVAVPLTIFFFYKYRNINIQYTVRPCRTRLYTPVLPPRGQRMIHRVRME